MNKSRVSLQDFCKIIQGGRHGLSGNHFVADGYPAYGAGGLNGYLPSYEFDQPGVILSSIGARCGKCFYAKGKWSSLANTQVIFPDPLRADPKFIWFQLNDERRWHRSGTGQPFIKPSDVKSHVIYLPPLSEQRRIAAILDKADALRAKRREALAQLDSLAQSMFLEMFGDPALHLANGRAAVMSDACEKITDGTHHSPDTRAEGIPYITAKHLRPDGLDFYSDPWFVSPEDHHAIYSRCDPRKGDVLYIKDGATTGIAAINEYDFPFSMLSSLALLRPRSGVCTAEYLTSWLNNEQVKKQMTGRMAGAGITRLTLGKIKQSKVYIPTYSEQKVFSERFRVIRALMKRQALMMESLNALFSSLQHRAFQGKL